MKDDFRENEKRYQALFDQDTYPILIMDQEGRYLDVNPAFIRFAEKTRESLLQMRAADFAPPGKETGRQTAPLIFPESEKTFESEYLVHGRIKTLELRLSPYSYKGRDAILGIGKDITGQKKMEKALKESEARFQLLYEKAPLGYQSLDETGCFLSVNQTWLDKLGYVREEIIGKSFADFLHPDWRDHFRENFPRFKAIGEVLGVEFEMVKKDGTLILVSFNGKIGRDKDGHFLQTHCIFHDITDQKRAEEKLRLSHEIFLTVLNSIDATIYVADIQTHEILFMNKNMIDSFGRDMTGEICFNAFREESGPCACCTNDQLIGTDGNPLGVHVWQDKNPITGKYYINHDRAIEWIDGRLVRLQIATDITEIRKMGEELRQAQKMESVGRLAGGVAHDFNNMLSIILGNTEMLLDDSDPDHPFMANLKEIQKAAERSANLTRQLLAFARKQTVSLEVIDLNATIEGMLKMLRRLIGEDIAVVWLPGPDLWPVRIDPSQIDQVLANLCVNARDAIENIGRITIQTCNAGYEEISCQEQEALLPGDYIGITVSDDGCGMDQAVLESLFEPFFTTKEVGKGTGLGMATVYGIVKQNNGGITVSSRLGEGTTIRIFLPRYLEAVQQPGPPKAAEAVPKGCETILLVEDETAILKMTAMMLERLGYTVFKAAGPSEALEIGSSCPGKIDLLMTDVVMPEMNGWDLAQDLLSRFPDLTCLFMSGYTADILSGGMNEGMQFIRKPFTMKDLAIKIREAFDKEKSPGPALIKDHDINR